MKPPPHERRGRDDARRERQAPSLINPVPTGRISHLSVPSRRDSIEAAFQDAYKAIDAEELAEWRSRFEAERAERIRRERNEIETAAAKYWRDAERRDRNRAAEAEREQNRQKQKRREDAKKRRRDRDRAAALAEAKRRERERIKELALLPPLPPNWDKATRRVRSRISHLTAENIHQHHLADQAKRYFDHLLNELFPLPGPSEWEYLSPLARFESQYEAGELAPGKEGSTWTP